MRLEKTITASNGAVITVKEITPAIWNNISKMMGEELLDMNISTFMSMEVSVLTDLCADMVVMPEETSLLDLGYDGLLEVWSAWREVNQSFLSLMAISLDKSQSKEPQANVEDGKPKES